MKSILPVPRRFLFIISAIVWTIVGIVLVYRSIGWTLIFELQEGILIQASGVILAVVGYVAGFSKIAKRNTERIHALPEQVSLFAFTGLRGYIMIGLMITIGIVLRNSSIPKYYLTMPYTAMGGALLIGSGQFYREFFRY